MDSEYLIQQLKRAIRRDDFQTDCPSDDQLASYHEGGLTDEEHGRLETHLADCGYCLSRVGALGRAVDTEADHPVPRLLLARARGLAEGSHAAVSRPRIHRRWAMAAAVLLVLGAASLFRPGDEITLTGLDVPGSPARGLRVSRSTDLDSLAVGKSLAGDGMGIRIERNGFNWSAVADSRFYQVRVVSDEGDLLWQERTSDTRWELPTGLQLASGDEYFLRVDAFITETKSVSSDYLGFAVR